MKGSYIEGSANHGGPEPCAGAREGVGEALDRGARRPAIEPRNTLSGVPTRSKTAEGNTVGGAFASRRRTPRGQRTCACV